MNVVKTYLILLKGSTESLPLDWRIQQKSEAYMSKCVHMLLLWSSLTCQMTMTLMDHTYLSLLFRISFYINMFACKF